MPPRKKPIDPEIVEAIWAAGVVSTNGSLALIKAGNTKVVRYSITSGVHPEAMARLGAFFGSSVNTIAQSNTDKVGHRIVLQGAALHSALTRVWEYLTKERKQQYADLRKEITSTVEGPNPYR